MTFHVSLVGRKDLSGEIYRQTRRAILDGGLRPGDRLSPTRDLARALAVSRTTVTVAYERLAGEGFITSRIGAGTFVRDGAARAQKQLSSRSNSSVRPRPIWESIPLPSAFSDPARFDFRTGLPDATLFPHRRWGRIVARAMRSREFAGGVYADPQGDPRLRSAIARHIAISRAVQGSAENIVVTNGTQQALDVVVRALLNPGDRIAVEDPGYQPPRHLFRSWGLRVIGIPVDREGMVVKALPRGVRAVYVTPSHQHPLGVTMSLQRRHALLAWAGRNDTTIIEDDYDSEFRFGGRPLEPLQTLDTAGRVIYVGSFSKTMLPTLRLGFLVAPPSLQPALQKAKYVTDWHTTLPLQAALARFIEGGDFARHVRRVSSVYRERHRLLTGILATDFARHLDVIPCECGFHVAAIATKANADEIRAVVRRALKKGVAVQVLSSFTPGNSKPTGLLLGYGAIATNNIEEGLRRLKSCF